MGDTGTLSFLTLSKHIPGTIPLSESDVQKEAECSTGCATRRDVVVAATGPKGTRRDVVVAATGPKGTRRDVVVSATEYRQTQDSTFISVRLR